MCRLLLPVPVSSRSWIFFCQAWSGGPKKDAGKEMLSGEKQTPCPPQKREVAAAQCLLHAGTKILSSQFAAHCARAREEQGLFS